MSGHPIRSAEVQAKVEGLSAILAKSCTAGKMLIELNYKDGCWRIGNVSVTAYPLKNSAEGESDPISHPGPRRVETTPR